MDPNRRRFIARGAAGVAFLLPGSGFAQQAAVFRPEEFGARGDGATNDTDAFARLSADVNLRGGGTVILGRGKTYLVGRQVRNTGRYF